MSTALLVVFGLIALGLLGVIIYRLSRNKSFATSDAIALLGLIVTLLVAILPFALDQGDAPTAAGPTVAIEGPDSARVGQRTYFTIVSGGATKAQWSIGGFAGGQVFEVNPLPPSHSIYVEPSDASRVGETFTLAVRVTAADGKTATATKRFVMIGP